MDNSYALNNLISKAEKMVAGDDDGLINGPVEYAMFGTLLWTASQHVKDLDGNGFTTPAEIKFLADAVYEDGKKGRASDLSDIRADYVGR